MHLYKELSKTETEHPSHPPLYTMRKENKISDFVHCEAVIVRKLKIASTCSLPPARALFSICIPYSFKKSIRSTMVYAVYFLYSLMGFFVHFHELSWENKCRKRLPIRMRTREKLHGVSRVSRPNLCVANFISILKN